MKKVLSNKFIQYFLCWLLHKYCLLSFCTSKIEFKNKEILDKYIDGNKPVIIAFWHGRLLFTPFVIDKKQRHKINVIISNHGDGNLISKAVSMFKVGQIRGSTNRTSDDKRGAKNRGGSQVIKQSIKLLKQNQIIAFTPDGPKGPRMNIKEISMLKIASMTGAAIIPITICASNASFFKSWDRFMLPHPFGKIILIIDDLIEVEKKSDEENLENSRKKLENRLNTITNEADMIMGITPIIPA